MLVIGLWLNIPDYDAPTQLVKPAERNTRYVNAVLTIPKVCAHLYHCTTCTSLRRNYCLCKCWHSICQKGLQDRILHAFPHLDSS